MSKADMPQPDMPQPDMPNLTKPNAEDSWRLGFAGTPEFAATILQALIDHQLAPVVVYSRPDKRKGRGRKTQASPVKQLALAHDIEVQQPPTLRKADYQTVLAQAQLDLFIVAAYGLILPPTVLALPKFGCLNVHASLLPRWRGAAPIERAIMAGDTETGICLMGMEEGLDTGPVFARRNTAITEQSHGAVLEDQLAQLGSKALVELLQRPAGERAQVLAAGEPQNDALATYANKLTNVDAQMQWHQPATTLCQQVRALSGRLPAVTQRGDLQVQILDATVAPSTEFNANPGTIVAIHKRGIVVATGEGLLQLTRLKLNRGKGNVMTPADLLNGYREYFEVNAYFV
jgi:methionyl-tRNA formyltransferase